jgi:hypothetical protein
MTPQQMDNLIQFASYPAFKHCSKFSAAGWSLNIAYGKYQFQFTLIDDYAIAYEMINKLRI